MRICVLICVWSELFNYRLGSTFGFRKLKTRQNWRKTKLNDRSVIIKSLHKSIFETTKLVNTYRYLCVTLIKFQNRISFFLWTKFGNIIVALNSDPDEQLNPNSSKRLDRDPHKNESGSETLIGTATTDTVYNLMPHAFKKIRISSRIYIRKCFSPLKGQ
jgi:hypothetical protein